MAPTASEEPSSQSEPADTSADETPNQANTANAQTSDPQPSAQEDPQIDAVAKVGDASFETLQAAVDQASEGQTIILQKDVTLVQPVLVNGKNFTLDLGTHALSAPSCEVLKITSSTVVIQNGTISSPNTMWYAAIAADRGSRVTVAQNATVIGTYAIAVNKVDNFGKDRDVKTAGEGTVIDVYGTVQGADDESILALGGTVGIAINGQVNSTVSDSYAKINIHDGATVTGHNGHSGKANDDDGPAVYAAGYGAWTVEDGATLTGGEALNIKSGTFVVNGGVFEANGDYHNPSTPWANGTVATGAALSVTDDASAYAKHVELEVNDGTFTSVNGFALYEDGGNGTALAENGLAVSGGTFTGQADVGAVYVKNANEFIAGGTFSSDPADYLAEGYVAKENAGSWTVEAYAAAKIGEKSYPTFQAALDEATDGQTIELVDNVALSETLTIDKAITLDLAQKTIATSASGWALMFTKDATVRGGTIAAETGSGILAKGCTVTIDDAVVNAKGKALQAGVFDEKNSSEQVVGHLVIDGENTSITSQLAGVLVVGINTADDAEKSSLVVNGGTIEGSWYGVLGNGSYDNTSITLNGGTVRATDPDDNAGIYHPQQGDLVINEGAIVEGKVGVQMGAGNLVVNGGTIKSSDTEARTAPYKTPSESDGSVVDGSALSVVSRAGGYGDISVEVNGGTFETANENNDAVKMYGFQKGATAWEIIEPPTNVDMTITGGTFASDPSAFVADGYKAIPQENGTYSVVDARVVEVTAPNGTVEKFTTLKEAVAAAETTAFTTKAAPEQPTTIKLLADTNDGIDIGASGKLLQNIVLDLNGCTLTLGPTVGSANTETNGVRVLSYSKLQVMNGKVVCSSLPQQLPDGKETYIKVGFANYGTLSLDNVDVQAGDYTQLTVNNRGALTLSGTTSIESGKAVDMVAVTNDVYDAHYADFDASLNVADDTVTVGKVLVERYEWDRKGNAGHVALNISAGTYGEIVDDGATSVPVDCNITGGTFASDPSAFVAEGYEAEKIGLTWTVGTVKPAAKIGEQEFGSLKEAIAQAQTGDKIVLLKNLVFKDSDIVTVDSGQDIVLDMNGKAIETTSDFAGRPIINKGILTIEGDGVIDSSNSKDKGYGAVDNYGTLVVEDGTYTGSVYASGAALKNRPEGEVVINGGTFNGATCALYNEGKTTVNNGVFDSAACNQVKNSAGESVYSYTVRSSGELYFNNGEVTGVQGALAIDEGYAEVKDGTFTAKLDEHADEGKNCTFYALYVAGETGEVEARISGGTFVSEGVNACCLIGNDSDGGLKENATAFITGGKFSTTNSNTPIFSSAGSESGNPNIMGGFYSQDVSAWAADLYECVESPDTAVEGYPYAVQMKRVAQVLNGDGEVVSIHPTLEIAIDAAQAGETVKLVKDIDLGDGNVRIAADKDMTLDFNGHSITTATNQFVIFNNGKLALCDSSDAKTKGSITGENASDGVYVSGENASLDIEDVTVTAKTRAVYAGAGTTVEMTSGKLQGKYALRAVNTASDLKTKVSISGGELIGSTQAVYLNANINAIEGGSIPYPVEVTVSGTASVKATGESAITVRGNGAKLNVEGGTIEGASGFGAIDGNGTMNASKNYGGTEINVSGGTILGGEVASTGIYHPQAGVLNVTGGTISGTTGIEMRAGTLNVSDDAAVVKGGTDPVTVTPNGNGGTTANAAVAVAQHSTKLPVEVNISGGTLEGGAALYESNPQNNSAEDVAKVTMSVTGGKLAGEVYSEDVENFVEGGLFSAEVDEAYIVEGFECAASGDANYPYEVVAIEHAQIGDVIYPTLEAAFKAVQAGETITVLKDTQMIDAAELAVEGAVTLNLAGHKVTGPVSEVSAAIVSKNDTYSTDLTIMSSEVGGAIDCSAGTCEVVKSYGVLTLSENVKLVGNARANSVTALGGTVDVNGADIAGGNCAVGLFNRNYDNEGTQEENPSAYLTVNSGTLSGASFAVSTNNLKSAGCTAVVNGGTLATDYTAIYWAAEGVVEVNGGTISGQTGIEMKMGDLTVNGGTIATIETDAGRPDGDPSKPYNGGSTEDGSGIYLVGKFYGASGKQFRESPDLTATINGGTVEAKYGNAISVYEGAAAVSNAARVLIPEGKDVSLTAAAGKEQVAYYQADGVEVPATRISALGIEGVQKNALTYAGVDGMALENPAQVTKYDIVDIANPSQADSTFKGWTVDPSDCNKGDAFNVVLQGVTKEATLTAGWQAVAGDAIVPPAVSDEPLADDAEAEVGMPVEHKQAVEEQAKEAAESIVKNVVENSEAAGVSAEDAKKIQDVVSSAEPTSTVTSTIAVTAEKKAEADVQTDADKIKTLVGGGTVEQYLDLKVTMVVEEKDASQENKAEVPLTTVEKPIPFSVKVAPSKLKNDDGSLKGVLIATVHNDVPSTIAPESIDYEKGIITFFADKFSTYGVVLNKNTASEPTYLESVNAFFANGTPVVITENTGADATEKPVLVSWKDANGDKTTTLDSNVSIFGGGHNDGRTFDTTNVTMSSGTVRNIFGGGLHKSNVGTANVAINGGTVTSVSGGGAAWLKDDGCGSAVAGSYPKDEAKINNFVTVANVTINEGAVTSTVFGGGESISSVETAHVTISGGDLSGAWVTAGGANGYTGNAQLNITGGTIKVVQGTNRGGTDSVNMDVSGGQIANLYLGGETGDSSVNGTIGAIEAVIGGQAKVDKLATGTSDGTDLAGQASVEASLKVEDTSKVGNFAEFAKASGDNLAVDATIDLSASANVVTFDPAAISAPYAAQSIKPEPKVLVNGVELDKGLYFFTYDKNVLPGTGTITVHGNDYVAGKTQIKGTASMNFTITAASKSNLQTALANAKSLRDATIASANGYDVVVGSWWASANAINAYGQAVMQADYANVQTFITQADVDAAVSNLAKATASFNSARHQVKSLNKNVLAANISAAKALRNATTKSSNGSDVAPGTWWATPLAISTYDQAIAKAVGVSGQAKTTQAAIDVAASDLAKATSAFQTARKQGTKQDVVAGSVKRLAGNVATGTSQAISKEGFTKSDYVVIARDDDFRDAMSATGLAGAYACPILLTGTQGLSSETAAEITRLGATKAIIVGGTGAISSSIDDQLKARGVKSERVFGNDAPLTSIACAKKIIEKTGNGSNVILASSYSFMDALSISSFAYKYKVPILLLNLDGSLPGGASAYLNGSKKLYVPGGPGAVPTSVTNPYGNKVERIFGNTGFDTSNAIAKYMVTNNLLTDKYVGTASGLFGNGVDALSGSALIGSKGGVLLLLDDGEGGAAIDDFLASHGKNVEQAYVFGGTVIVKPAMYSKIESLVK